MKLVDLNLLVYAVNRDSPAHASAKSWILSALSAEEPIVLCWAVLLGFLRITTQHRILSKPLTAERAIEVVDGWVNHPLVRIIGPGPDHWRILQHLLTETGVAGNLTTDAHLAALAIEHGFELCSTDRDFSRFPGLNWLNPLG